jgi:hypothetical protein
MASNAGMNRVSELLISATMNSTAVTGAPATYGISGINDTGIALCEARDFKSWTFMLTGGGTGYSFSIYGTVDPLAYAVWRSQWNPQAYFGRVGGPPTLPGTSWVLLPGPSDQAGTGTSANPLTEASPIFQYNGALVACRVVLTTAGSAGIAAVVAEVTP